MVPAEVHKCYAMADEELLSGGDSALNQEAATSVWNRALLDKWESTKEEPGAGTYLLNPTAAVCISGCPL